MCAVSIGFAKVVTFLLTRGVHQLQGVMTVPGVSGFAQNCPLDLSLDSGNDMYGLQATKYHTVRRTQVQCDLCNKVRMVSWLVPQTCGAFLKLSPANHTFQQFVNLFYLDRHMDMHHADHLLDRGCLADYCDILGCEGSPEAKCSPYTDMTLIKNRCHNVFHKCFPPNAFPVANHKFMEYCDGLTCSIPEGRIVAPRPWEATNVTATTIRRIFMGMAGGILMLILSIAFCFRPHAHMPKDLQRLSVHDQRGGLFDRRHKVKQG